ncbi:MAG: hypothetical protein NZM31_01425 [Gemmatales bacterium]|nr:hypothetical protein [Gemmatales bacterium]MDW8385657.1 hypothetical protein [Gemmatales bacterium]
MVLKFRMATVAAVLLMLASATSAWAATPSKYLPDDSQMVLRIKVRELLDSDIVKKNALEQIKTGLRENIQLGLIFESLGFDPLRDIDVLTVSLGDFRMVAPMPGAVPESPFGNIFFLVEGKFDLDKVHTTLADAAKQMPDQISVSAYGGLKLYEAKQNDQTMFVVFLDPNTAILGNKKELVTNAVDVKQAKRKPNLNRTVVNMLTKVSDNDTVIMAMPLPKEAKEAARGNPQMALLVEALEGFTGSVTASKDLNIGLFIHTTEAQAAQQIRGQLEGLKLIAAGALQGQGVPGGEILAQMIQEAKTDANGKTISVKMTLTQEMIDKAGR